MPGLDFFGDERVLRTIDRLASTDTLTLVVGAGGSVEAGLPDWRQLIQRLVEEVGRLAGLRTDDLEAFCDWTLRREGLAGAGAVAKAELGDNFAETLRQGLYREVADPAPGETSRAIAELRVDFLETDCEVVTTNYDGLLAEALRVVTEQRRIAGEAALSGVRVVRAATERPPGTKELLVRHLHGVVLPDGRSLGNVVLSEDDYHLMQDSTSWQEGYFQGRLISSTCLFIGTSLSDPNLLRYLYRTKTSQSHIALFARQQDAELYDSVASAVAAAKERSAEGRWRGVGVEPLNLDYFTQGAQFIEEITHRRRLGPAYNPLPERLAVWEDALGEGVLRTSMATFHANQETFQAILADLLEASRDVLKGAGHRLGHGERLGVSLWIYRPATNTLVNWASADRLWRDPGTMEPVPVHWQSDFVAVQAFCSGSLVSTSTERQVATRWNHVIGFPVFVRSNQLGRIPAGVVTLASTASPARSLLHRAIQAVRRDVAPQVAELAAELLTPENL